MDLRKKNFKKMCHVALVKRNYQIGFTGSAHHLSVRRTDILATQNHTDALKQYLHRNQRNM